MVIFHSHVSLPEGTTIFVHVDWSDSGSCISGNMASGHWYTSHHLPAEFYSSTNQVHGDTRARRLHAGEI